MHKLLLILVAFSSGVLWNVAQNLAEGGPTADSVLPTAITILLDGHKEFYNRVNTCCVSNVQRNDYVVIPGMGAHKLHVHKMTWNNARKSCMGEGGQLAIINSDGEAAILLNWMKRENIGIAWLGVHDKFDEGDWVTLKGEMLETAGYDKWLPGEPNNHGDHEHCGTLQAADGLNDVPCHDKFPYFCKIYVC